MTTSKPVTLGATSKPAAATLHEGDLAKATLPKAEAAPLANPRRVRRRWSRPVTR